MRLQPAAHGFDNLGVGGPDLGSDLAGKPLGVAFAGHPDLRRTYMWQDHFDHHPLLKSFEISTKRTFEGLR